MFPEKITAYYRSLFTGNIENDPLQRLVCRLPAEENRSPDESDDPTGDSLFAHGKIIHRYPSRALLLLTGRCPAHCRFCFRRGQTARYADIDDEELTQACGYLREHEEIREIILSGGDPLSLPNSRLLEIIELLKGVRRDLLIRVHTRFPIYEPSRCIGFEAVAALVDVFVLHINHPREITLETRRALQVLARHAPLFNQSVLLRGINDSLTVLIELSYTLFRAGVIPYYLHYPDNAYGIAHFRPTHSAAAALVATLPKYLPGYLIPRLMVTNTAKQGKIVLDPPLESE